MVIARMIRKAAIDGSPLSPTWRGGSCNTDGLPAVDVESDLDGIAKAELKRAVAAAEGDDKDDPLPSLPTEFASQAAQMPLYIRRLLIDNIHPSNASIGSVIRSLRLPPEELQVVLAALQQPSKELLLRSEGFLDRPTCKALRAAVDAANSKAANKKADSVDGLAEHQLDLTMDSLLELTGPDVLERLRSLPTRFAASGGRCSQGGTKEEEEKEVNGLVIQRAFVRRYASTERPWFTFHMDTARLTANIALSSDSEHEGGRLLALLGGEGVVVIERQEGEATVHPSSLLHGVSCMKGRGVRYSLIVFYRGVGES